MSQDGKYGPGTIVTVFGERGPWEVAYSHKVNDSIIYDLKPLDGQDLGRAKSIYVSEGDITPA